MPEYITRMENYDESDQFLQSAALAKGGAGHSMTLLPEDFVPGEYDVICGRGRRIFMHPGNVRFRRIVEDCLAEYSNTVTKMEKTFILGDIIAQVRANSPDGGFVKKDAKDGRWYEVGDYLAREKTSQAFRDALFDQYKSSNTAKKLRKRGEKLEIMPRRAFSTTTLDSKPASSLSSKGGYVDPLIAKLRSRQSARSVLDFGEGGRNASFGGRPSIQQSCPNLSAGISSRNATSSNFEWGANNAASSVSDNKNFEWGAPASPQQTRKSSLDFLKSTLAGSKPQQPKSNPFFAMLQQRNNRTSSSNNANGMAFPESTQSNHINDLLGGAMMPSPVAAPMKTPGSEIEAKLAQLRESTFEEGGSGHHNEPLMDVQEDPLLEEMMASLAEPLYDVDDSEQQDEQVGHQQALQQQQQHHHLQQYQPSQDSEIDVFDQLVDLVGDVGPGDPFEPDPLP